MSFDPESFMDALGTAGDADIDLAKAALALAAPSHPGLSFDRYLHHLDKLSADVAAVKAGNTAESRLNALTQVIAGTHGYDGDHETYDDLQNADLVRVIDRRKGLPITLTILYIHAGRAQGWNVDGLNFPGHVLVRMDLDGHRLIFDPFNKGKVVHAPDLRVLVKKALGPKAELSADYYKAATNREMLIRLQNNIKLRQIAGEDYEAALHTVSAMRKIDPREYRLLLDAGVLCARTGRARDAIVMLENYIEKAPDPGDRQDAAALLRQIRASLN